MTADPARAKREGGTITKVHASCGVGAVVNLRGAPQHELVEDGFRVLVNLDHRGARGAEEKTGDGAGMLLQIPDAFFRDEVSGLPQPGLYGVAQVFLPREEKRRTRLRRLID